MRVLVTGGMGFIGRHLCRSLEHAGHGVVCFDRQAYGDIMNAHQLELAMAKCDAVVHLAAETGVAASVQWPEQTMQINAIGSQKVFEAARKNGIKRVVAASTAGAIAGNQAPVTPLTAPEPHSPYGASKLAMEGLLSAYTQSYGMKCCALRFTNVYGPGSEDKASAVATFCKAIINRDSVTVYGDGSQLRDYVHVADVVRAIEAALRRDVIGPYVIGSGVATSIQRILGILNIDAGRIKYEAARPGEVHATWGDISAAKRDLVWWPSVDIENGLKETLKWFRSQ